MSFLQHAMHHGPVDCPTCGQRVQFYKRRLNASMAETLIKVYKLTRSRPERTAHVDEFRPENGNGDYAKLRFWGLLEPLSRRNNEGNASGAWRITPYGELFVEGTAQAWSHMLVFNNQAYGYAKAEQVSIVEALGRPFDYKETVTPGA